MRSRRIATTLAVAALVTGAATPAAAASAPGPRPVADRLEPVPAGTTTWVGVAWTTGRKICDAAVTVEGDAVEIGYPANTGTHTSFSRGDMLEPGRPDFTAFSVRPRRDELFLRLAATLSYDTCGRHAVEKARIYRLTLPVTPGGSP